MTPRTLIDMASGTPVKTDHGLDQETDTVSLPVLSPILLPWAQNRTEAAR